MRLSSWSRGALRAAFCAACAFAGAFLLLSTSRAVASGSVLPPAALALIGGALFGSLAAALLAWIGWSRSKRFAERARLSATAEGFPEAGALVARELGRSRNTWGASALFLCVGAAVIGLPLLWLRAAGSPTPLFTGTTLAAAGASVVFGVTAVLLWSGACRCRSIGLAQEILERGRAPERARSAVHSALRATRSPGPLVPATVLAGLVLLAAVGLTAQELRDADGPSLTVRK